MPELQRLEIKDFQGLSTKKHATLIEDLKTPDSQGMFVSPQGALTPIPLINSETTGLSFTQTIATIPFILTNGTRYLVVSDGLDLASTTGDGTYSYIGYTSGTVTRSGTALTGTSTAWSTNIVSGDQFKYDADSTWLNISVVGSDTSITLTSGSGATSGAYKIRKRLNGSLRPKGVVMNDLLILTGGSRLSDKWDGTSLQDISGMPTMDGLVIHKRHVFGWAASTIYWSDLNTPTTWTGTNTEVISQKDGGQIVNCVSYGNALCIFKSNGKLYQFLGNAPFAATTITYQIQEVDMPEAIGTIAPETCTVHKGLLYFLASTGVYAFNGVSVEKITLDIDPTINAIQFPSGIGSQSSSSYVDDTSTEFASGTHSSTEYDSTNAGVQLDHDASFDTFADNDYTANPTWTVQSGTWSAATGKLVSTGTTAGTVNRITTPSTVAYNTWIFDVTPNGTNVNINKYEVFFITDDTSSTGNGYKIKATSAFGSSSMTWNFYRQTGSTESLLGTLGNSVYGNTLTWTITRTSAGQFDISFTGGNTVPLTVTDTTYTTSTYFKIQATITNTNDSAFNITVDNIKISAISGNFISQVFDGGTSLVQWDNITFNSIANGETVTFSYRAEAANPPTGAFTTITSGQTITTNKTNRYLQYKLTFTSTTKIGISALVSSATVNFTYSLDVPNKPVAKSFKDRWHLSYSTGGSTNTDTLILDEKYQWLPWKGKVGCFGIFNNQLYGGGTDGTVKIWYTGSTTVGQSRYWKSKTFNFDLPEYMKDFDRVVIVFKFTSASCSLDYSIDDNSFVTNTLSLAQASSTDQPIRSVANLGSGSRIQFRILFSDETQDFEIHRVIVYYKVLELRAQ